MGRNSKDNSLKKRRIVESIAKEYFICLHKQNLKTLFFTLSEGKSTYGKTLKEICDYISKVEFTFSQLDALDKTFINNEFFYTEDSNWWIDIYPQSTFYRLRAKAVNCFLTMWNLVSSEQV